MHESFRETKLILFFRWCVNPTKKFISFKELRFRSLIWKSYAFPWANLRNHYNTLYLSYTSFHCDTENITKYRYFKVWNTDKSFKEIFGKDISKARIFNIFGVSPNIIGAHEHVCSWEGSEPPISMRFKLCLLVICCSCCSNSLILLICRLDSHCSSLRRFILNIFDLLSLNTGRRKFHTKNNISYFKLS